MPSLMTRRCAYCNGTGRVDVGEFAPDYRTCPVCQGNKQVRVPSDYVPCGVCGGSGKKDTGDYIKHIVSCTNCKGSGWAPPPPTIR